MAQRWYVVHVHSGFEKKVAQNLREQAKIQEMDDLVTEILVPTEEVVELRGGAKQTRQKKLMPGYMFIQMELVTEAWHCVKDTEKITGFVGDDKNPKPISEREIKKLTQQVEEGAVRPTTQKMFEEGTNVRVVDGPFLNFSGTVEEVLSAKQKVRVLVSIFGRATPVELDFMQVERM